MEEEKNKEFKQNTGCRIGKELTHAKIAESQFKRAIDYNYQQVVSEYAQVPATQVASEKVTIMVGTFLNEYMESMPIIGLTTKMSNNFTVRY